MHTFFLLPYALLVLQYFMCYLVRYLLAKKVITSFFLLTEKKEASIFFFYEARYKS
jgi:hypothetical protein